MTPEEIARGKSEHSEQAALFAWANMAAQYGFEWASDSRCYDIRIRPDLELSGMPRYEVSVLNRLFAIHNQGHGDKIRGARAKAEGLRAGVPDIMLPVPSSHYFGLFIELKREKAGKPSDAQIDWVRYLNNAGYKAAVIHGWRAAADMLKIYLQSG